MVPPALKGALSSSPVSTMLPAAAWIVRSLCAQAALGPSTPYGVMDTLIRCELSSAICSRPSPIDSMTPWSKDSNKMSALRINSLRLLRPPSVAKSNTTLFLPLLYAQWCSECSPSSTSSAKGPSWRALDPAGGSIAMTSAPIWARMNAARWPRSSVRSKTLYSLSINPPLKLRFIVCDDSPT